MSKKKKDKEKSKGFFGAGLGLTDPNEAKKILEKHKSITISVYDLLKNPDIEDGPLGDFSPGGHHSQNFVKYVSEAIQNSRILDHYIKKITSAEYGPRKRGKLQIGTKPFDINHYSLFIYDKRSDAGFAAEVEFHAKEKWKVVILSKILRLKVGPLYDYAIDVRSEKNQ